MNWILKIASIRISLLEKVLKHLKNSWKSIWVLWKHFSLAMRKSWQMQLNASDKSVRTASKILLISATLFHLSIIKRRQCCGRYPFLKPQWNFKRNLSNTFQIFLKWVVEYWLVCSYHFDSWALLKCKLGWIYRFITLKINIFRKKLTISYKISAGITISCTALLKFNFLIFLRTVLLSPGEK